MKSSCIFTVAVSVALFASSLTATQAAVVPVTGGGTALSTAITTAVAGDEIVIQDSLTNYAMGAISKPLTIRALAGETPAIASGTIAVPSSAGGLLKFEGITFSYAPLFTAAFTASGNYSIEINDCTFRAATTCSPTYAGSVSFVGNTFKASAAGAGVAFLAFSGSIASTATLATDLYR